MKKFVILIVISFSPFVFASDWTAAARPEKVEVIRGQGFQIEGSFGNPSECDSPNSIFVSINHPQYDQLLSVAVSAFMGGKKLRIYSHQCVIYGWHGGSYNELTAGGSMYLLN